MRQFGGFKQAALLDQPEPVGNEVVYRAIPLAIGVAAVDTARRLIGRLFLLVLAIDFLPSQHAHRYRHHFRILAR